MQSGAVAVVLLVLLLAPGQLGQAVTNSEPLATGEDAVEEMSGLPGFDTAETDEDMADIYRENLALDMKHWQGLGHPLGASDLATQLLEALTSKYLAVFVIKDTRVHMFKQKGVVPFAYKRMQRMQAQIVQSMNNNTKLRFPNTIFLFNAEDEPLCHRMKTGECIVPIFSCFKRWDGPNLGTGKGLQRVNDTDVLMPHLGLPHDLLYMYPWEKKDPRALLRASFQSSMSANSTRVLLSNMSAFDPEGQRLLDAGIVWTRNKEVPLAPEQMRSFVSIKRSAKWRFLINTDGHTASVRLGQVMLTNSVVLKEESPYIEWYYRSLRDRVHFYGFNLDNILPQLRELSEPKRDAELRRVATTAQKFAFRFLNFQARVLYIRQALLAYNSLFDPTIDEVMAKVDSQGEISFRRIVMLMHESGRQGAARRSRALLAGSRRHQHNEGSLLQQQLERLGELYHLDDAEGGPSHAG